MVQVTFPATYKYQLNSDDFNLQRTPAWCDRVLYRHEVSADEVARRVVGDSPPEVEVVDYDSFPLRKTSDHRPVAALFRVTMPDPIPELS